MPLLQVRHEVEDAMVAHDVGEKLQGRVGPIYRDLVRRLAEDLMKSEHVKIVYRRNEMRGTTIVTLSLVVGQEHMVTHTLAEEGGYETYRTSR